MKNISSKTYRLFLIIAGVTLFFPFLGQVHLFDWDEINFAESAREMLVSGNFIDVQIDFKAFWEKPPLFIWLQALSMKIFGVNEFAARFPNALCGVLTLLLLFEIGKKLYNKVFGFIWAVVYIGSFLSFFYFKSGIIDPWFNLFIFLSIYFAYKYLKYSVHEIRNISLSGLFIGLAVLTKGPAGFLVFGLTAFAYMAYKKFKVNIKIKHILIFTAIFIFTGGFWFILQILSGNFGVIEDFIVYQIRLFKTQDAGHGGFFMYHFVVVFLGLTPASVFALPVFANKIKTPDSIKMFKQIMMILFWVVIILFSIVKTKIVHYSSLTYLPLTFLSTLYIYHLLKHKKRSPKSLNFVLIFNTLFFAIAVGVFPLIEIFKADLLNGNLISNSFTRGNLEASVSPGIIPYILSGILIISVFFYRKYLLLPFFMYALFAFSGMVFVVPDVEKYSQHAAIEFIKSKKDEDCYIYPLGHKSYAHLFYGNKKPNQKRYTESEILDGEAHKPTYFVIKKHRLQTYLKASKHLKIIEEKNGYVFAYVKGASEVVD